MRSVHCTLAALIVLSLAPAGLAQELPAPTAPGSSRFTVFAGGRPVGSESVTVTRSANGVTITGSGSMPPPVDVVTRRYEVVYDSDMRPRELTLDGVTRGQSFTLHTTFADGTAWSELNQGPQSTKKTDTVPADAVVLLVQAAGPYEALAMRLATLQPGAQVPAYMAPQSSAPIRFDSVSPERIQTPAALVNARRYHLTFRNPSGDVPFELWTDGAGRMIRMAVPSQSFEVAREDVASVAARRVVLPRPGDEQLMIPANGFNLAATVSRPPGTTPAAVRLPAVVLVGGSGPADRDESLAGIPIFAQIAGALADAGFLVIRYDKRGVGQSGGRAESATIADYAEDLRAAVKYASKRKDVDKNRVAVLGHGEGGWVALVAASKEKAVKAVVLAETAATTGSELVLEQQRQALSRMNIPEAEKQAKIDLQQKIDQAVLSGRGWDDIPRDVRRQAETPWFQSFLAFTPAPVLKKVKVPILIVQGELDTQVPPHHADDLAALARARKDSRVEVVKVPGVNHLLVPARSGEAGEYADLKDATVSAPLMSAVVDWLHKAIPVKP